MIKIRIQIPDDLYREAKRVAREREMSLAEVVRRGLECMTMVYPPLASSETWSPPKPNHLGSFAKPPDEWRELASIPSPESEER